MEEIARTLTGRNLDAKTLTENMLEKMKIIVVLGNVSVVVLSSVVYVSVVHSTNRLCGLRSEVEKGEKSVGTCQTEPLIFGGA